MRHSLRHLTMVALLASACGGSSGDPAASNPLGGLAPIPGGFKTENRMENAIGLRVTDSGLGFLEKEGPALAGDLLGGALGGTSQGNQLKIEIPRMEQPIEIFGLGISTAYICEDGPNAGSNPPKCVVELDLSKLKLDIKPTAPHALVIDALVPIRLQDLPIRVDLWPWDLETSARLSDDGCSARAFANVPVTITVRLAADVNPAHKGRYGYTAAQLTKDDIKLDTSGLIKQLSVCGGNGLTDAIMNGLKNLVGGLIAPMLMDPLLGSIDQALCTTKADPKTGVTCPEGSSPDGDQICRWNDNKACVPMALGIDGRIDIGALLASIAPGNDAALDLLAALGGQSARPGTPEHWGDLNPANKGITLSLMGGGEPGAQSLCVPTAPLKRPAVTPLADELTANTVTGWTGPGPHLGVGVGESYLNHVLASVYNAGTLCLGVPSTIIPQITLGTSALSLTMGLKSILDLPIQRENQGVFMVLRPQKPPTITVGNGSDKNADPLLLVEVPEFEIDFYLWAHDRQIRAFTAKFDLAVPITLGMNAEDMLEIAIGNIGMNNPTVINAPLLRPDELTKAGSALASLVTDLASGEIAKAVPPVDLNSMLASLGLGLTIPDGGFRKLEKDGERLLGLFATLKRVPKPDPNAPKPYVLRANTSAEFVSARVTAEGVDAVTHDENNAPAFVVRLGSTLESGDQEVEYQHRLDGGAWHFWTTESDLLVDSPVLMLEGRHRLEVRSRLVGDPHSTDPTPAVLDLVVDVSAPVITLEPGEDEQLLVSLSDTVSHVENIDVRWALDNGAFTTWFPASELDTISVGDAELVTVEARDESGQVASQQQAIVRGRPDPTLAAPPADSAGCGCRVSAGGSSSTPTGAGLAGLAALGAAFFLRRRTSAATLRGRAARLAAPLLGGAALAGVALLASGCSCSETPTAEEPKPDVPTPPATGPTGKLVPGVIGAYASAAVASDGTVYVSGYSDTGATVSLTTEVSVDETHNFGDLVFGKWSGDHVDWESVDGVPKDGDPQVTVYGETPGFRGNITEAGDNVGLWTSLALSASGEPRIAYYDVKNRALKFAMRKTDGWEIHTVQKKIQSDLGRYAKLLLVDGKPVIAYLAIEGSAEGPVTSSVRVARAKVGAPTKASDWEFEEAFAPASTPCRAHLCPTSMKCRASTLHCERTVDGCDLSSGQGCFPADGAGGAAGAAGASGEAGTAGTAGTAGAGGGAGGTPSGAPPVADEVLSKTYADTYPEATGLYVSLAETATGLGIVFYDRYHGNLVAVRKDGDTWQTPLLLDGETLVDGKRNDTGDVGIGASLFIDAAGDWHVAYANGIDESVRYVKVALGATPGAVELVDDGRGAPGTGIKGIVGDDTAITVDKDGSVHIAYQNATTGELRWATGAPNGDAHSWQTKVVSVAGFAGAFNQILSLGGERKVMTWSRTYTAERPSARADVTFVKP